MKTKTYQPTTPKSILRLEPEPSLVGRKYSIIIHMIITVGPALSIILLV